MNPYDETIEEVKRQSGRPKKLINTAIETGSTLAGVGSFANVLSKAAPLLSQYVPEKFAIAGLSKLSPKFGKFISEALGNGFDFNEVKDFIGGQITESQKENKGTWQNGDPISEESPELYEYLKSEFGKGTKFIDAVKKSTTEPKHKGVIEKLTKKYERSWPSIVRVVFGGALKNDKTLHDELEMNQPQPTQQSQPQQQQTGQGKQALLDIMQKINQRLGK